MRPEQPEHDAEEQVVERGDRPLAVPEPSLVAQEDVAHRRRMLGEQEAVREVVVLMAVEERLIDEELLVARGLELGLARRDPRVRKDLTASVIDAVAVTGFAVNFSPIPQIAPPPFGRATAGGCRKNESEEPGACAGCAENIRVCRSCRPSPGVIP